MVHRKVLGILLGVLMSFSAFAADISGTWTGEVDTPLGHQSYTFIFKTSGTTLTGSAKSEFGESALKDGKVDGKTVTFVETMSMQGQDLALTYTGEIVSKDEIKFSRDIAGFAQDELVIKRAK